MNACFKQKSTLVKCLIFLVSVLIMILVALAITLVKRKEESQICKTPHCIKLSAEVMRYIDKTKNPCDDFHSFTCGGFFKNHKEIPPPSPKQVLNYMVSEMVQNGDSKPFIMEKSFYASCSNVAAIEVDDDETLLELFYALGDWPVLRGANWDGSTFEWTDLAKKSRKLGLKFDWFLDFSVYEDRNDTGLNILKIDIPPLSKLKNSEIFPRQRLLTQIAITLGAPEKLAHYETGRTIDFENYLRNLTEEHRSNKKNWNALSLPKITINELQELWPNINWLDLINNITGVRMISSDHVVFDEVLDYLTDLNKLIYGTPKRIVADYMMWKIVEENWQFLTQPVREKFEDFEYEQYATQVELDRLKFCVNESRKQFPLVVETEYIRRHVTFQKRKLVEEMVQIVVNNYRRLIDAAHWMNRQKRDRARRKLEEMKVLVGGPREVFDEFGFAEDLGLYNFVFKSNNIIDMLTERKLRFYDHYFSVLNRGVTNTTQRFYEKVVNIDRFSVINGNIIVIPAAVLRDAFYDPALPNDFNFATLGNIVAKEIFDHIFERNNETIIDDENQNYDSRWISDVFDSAVKCLVKDISYIHNSELKRPKHMREHLSDLIATEVAYESYREWLIFHPESKEFKLPALEYSPSQLFWIHTSKLHCNKIYSKHDRDYSRFKIIAPLRNSRNFARDYSCLDGSKMYAKKTCRIL